MPARKDSLDALVSVSLEKLNFMLDSGKMLGTPLQVKEGMIIIPIARVTFGFGSGGSEFPGSEKQVNPLSYEAADDVFPYGGGSLGGVAIRPEAFLVITDKETKVIPMEEKKLYHKALDLLVAAVKKKKK